MHRLKPAAHVRTIGERKKRLRVNLRHLVCRGPLPMGEFLTDVVELLDHQDRRIRCLEEILEALIAESIHNGESE